MELDEVFGTIRLEETKFMELKKIKSGYHEIELINEAGKVVDGVVLAEYFRQIPGIDKIDSLTITFSSSLEDVSIIKGFPNLVNLIVNGHNIMSLSGLSYFKNGFYLCIQTESNRNRCITGIDQVPITRLELFYENAKDFEVISTSRTISYLDINYCPQPMFDKWMDVPLDSLQLTGGKFIELGDTKLVKSLRKLVIVRCKKFERFVGDNSNITWALIDGCVSLDIKTIKTFIGIEALQIFTNHHEVPLSFFMKFKKLRKLSLVNCNVLIDIQNLKESIPNLETLHITSLKKEQVIELSQLNEGVKISR